MKPILFNTEMVRAVLEGRKTVTRRVVKPQPFAVKQDESTSCWCGHFVSESGKVLADKPPYRPGDILYVRETWRVQSARRFDADARIEFKAGGDMVRIQFPGGGCQYHSRGEYDAFVARWVDDRWHPSIHMPREAARIFLRVTDVRVERLRSMSDTQCMAEGVTCPWNVDLPDAFAELWNNTIKPADRALYGWEANPWVWVIGFERCEKPEAAS